MLGQAVALFVIPLTLIILYLIIVLLSRLIPPVEKPDFSKVNLPAVKNKFRWFNFIYSTVFIIMTLIISVLVSRNLMALRHEIINKMPGVIYYDTLPGAFFGIFTFIIGGFLVAGFLSPLVDFMGRKIAGSSNEWRAFFYEWNKKWSYGYEIDPKKSNIFMIIFFVIPSSIMLYFGFNAHTILTPQGFYQRKIFSVSERYYPLGVLNKIMYIKSFKNRQSGQVEKTSPYYVLSMKDGSRIFLSLSNSKNTSELVKSIDFISRSSGLPVKEHVHNMDDL